MSNVEKWAKLWIGMDVNRITTIPWITANITEAKNAGFELAEKADKYDIIEKLFGPGIEQLLEAGRNVVD